MRFIDSFPHLLVWCVRRVHTHLLEKCVCL